MVNRLDLFRDRDVGFIVWLDQRCPNSLWWTRGVEPESVPVVRNVVERISVLRGGLLAHRSADEKLSSKCGFGAANNLDCRRASRR